MSMNSIKSTHNFSLGFILVVLALSLPSSVYGFSISEFFRPVIKVDKIEESMKRVIPGPDSQFGKRTCLELCDAKSGIREGLRSIDLPSWNVPRSEGIGLRTGSVWKQQILPYYIESNNVPTDRTSYHTIGGNRVRIDPLNTNSYDVTVLSESGLGIAQYEAGPLNTFRVRTNGLAKQSVSTDDITHHGIGTGSVQAQGVYAQGIGSQRVTTGTVGSQDIYSQRVGIQKVGSQNITTQRVGTQRVGAQYLSTQDLEAQRVGTSKLRTQKVSTQNVYAQKVSNQKVSTKKISSQRISKQKIGNQKVGTRTLSYRTIGSQQLTTKKLASQSISATRLRTNELTSRSVGTQGLSAQKIYSQRVSTQSVGTQKVFNPISFSTTPIKFGRSEKINYRYQNELNEYREKQARKQHETMSYSIRNTTDNERQFSHKYAQVLRH